jgi:hypothetical protein
MAPLPRRRSRARAWVPPLLLAALVATVLVVAATLLGDGGGRRRAGTNPPRPAVTVASVSSFDPEGDGTENEGQVGAAHDGDPASAWATDRYRGPKFGNLKSGVGLVLRLAGPADLGRLTVRSPTSGWSAAVYVADQPGSALAAWGRPAATRSGIDGDASFDLDGRRGGAVLLWITDPGPDNRAEVSEVSVTG